MEMSLRKENPIATGENALSPIGEMEGLRVTWPTSGHRNYELMGNLPTLLSHNSESYSLKAVTPKAFGVRAQEV